jgi:hypothetical protein
MEPRQAEAFLKKPDAGIGGGVIHVGDDGLVAERAAFRLALTRAAPRQTCKRAALKDVESVSSVPVGM